MTDVLKSLLQAQFAGIAFPVEEETATFGQDGVDHKVYLVDGADIEPTGASQQKGQLVALFFNDLEPDLFPDRYTQFVAAVKQNRIGTLHHPVDGIIEVQIRTVSRSTKASARNGVKLTIEYAEHNASATDVIDLRGQTPQDAQNSIEALATSVDTAMSTADSTNSFKPTLPVITEELDKLSTASPKPTYSQTTASIKKMVDVVEENLLLDVFSGNDSYQAVLALEQLRVTIYKLRDQLLPDAARMNEFVVTTPLSLSQVSQLFYGDAQYGSDILAVNKISNIKRIKPGTKLQMPAID